MLNKDRPFADFNESLEAYCAEVLCNGERGGFWEHYREDGPDIEKYLAQDYEGGIAKYHDWLWEESTEGKAKPPQEDEEEEGKETEDAETCQHQHLGFVRLTDPVCSDFSWLRTCLDAKARKLKYAIPTYS